MFDCASPVEEGSPLTADSPIHGSAMLQMNTGKILSGSPCLGSWVNYGLGSLNENLPGFVVMLDPRGGPIAGVVVVVPSALVIPWRTDIREGKR